MRHQSPDDVPQESDDLLAWARDAIGSLRIVLPGPGGSVVGVQPYFAICECRDGRRLAVRGRGLAHILTISLGGGVCRLWLSPDAARAAGLIVEGLPVRDLCPARIDGLRRPRPERRHAIS